jgi:hypothetical protein
MADSSTELVINIIVIFLVLLSYVVPFLLRSLKKKRERERAGQGPEPVESIEKTFKSLETVLTGETDEEAIEEAAGDNGPAAGPAEARSIEAAARAALKDASALAGRLRQLERLAPLAALVEREIMEPLENVRRAAAVLVRNPEEPGTDAAFAVAGHATMMNKTYLIQALNEIVSSWHDERLVSRSRPAVRLAEAFFARLGAALTDLYPGFDRMVPVAVPAPVYGSMIQDEELSTAGIILYPAAVAPAASPMDYSVPLFYLAANFSGALVTDVVLESAGLSPQARPTMVILAGHYVACSLLGPAYIEAMRTVKQDLFTDEELEACRRALADQPMSLTRMEREEHDVPASESARPWGEALVSLPLFGGPGLRALADRSAIDAVSGSLVAQAHKTTRSHPIILLVGAMSAAARYPEAAGRLARTLEALLTGERLEPKPRRRREARQVPGATLPAHAALRTDEIVSAVVLGAFFMPPLCRRHGFNRPPIL